MLGLNDYIPTPVLTQRGPMDIKDVVPTDRVYEYRTGKLLEVQGIKKVDSDKIFRIEYNDGRSTDIHLLSNIYAGEGLGILPLTRVLALPFLGIIPQYHIDFQYQLKAAPEPDPYIIGALLTFADYSDRYVNLAISKNGGNHYDPALTNTHLENAYKLKIAEDISNGNTHYHWDGTPSDQCLSWEEFLSGYDCFLVTHSTASPIFPREYQYASVKMRAKLLMGAFDLGYPDDRYLGALGINHKHEFMLIELRKILNSLGYIGVISYHKNSESSNPFYHLQIIGISEDAPRFHYDIYSIEDHIRLSQALRPMLPFFELRINRIYPYTQGWMYNLVLEKRNGIYVDANFLPRVSV